MEMSGNSKEISSSPRGGCPQSPLVVALDMDSRAEALQWVKRLGNCVDVFKVGLQLFLREGIPVVEAIAAEGKRVFLDLKLHDIPNTVQHAARSLAIPGVEFITVHASGGAEMMSAAVSAVREQRSKNPLITTRVLAVTILTSLDDADLRQMGLDHSVSGQVLNLARLARSAGVEGLVASPQETRLLRAEHSNNLVLVTPGVRPAGVESHDQKRIMTPRQAMQEGSDFLVMGRSLLKAPEPEKTVRQILAEMTG